MIHTGAFLRSVCCIQSNRLVVCCVVSVVRIGLNESQHKRLLFVQVQLPKACPEGMIELYAQGYFFLLNEKDYGHS